MLWFFLSFRDSVIESYPEIYGSDTDERGELGAAQTFGKKWGWYQSIYGLAKGDILKFDRVTELELHKCLTYLVFEQEKNKIEQQMIKNSYK